VCPPALTGSGMGGRLNREQRQPMFDNDGMTDALKCRFDVVTMLDACINRGRLRLDIAKGERRRKHVISER
jgi:hypothetical protein